MKPVEKICAISFDEMEVQEALAYSKQYKSFLGLVTFGNTSVKANHLLVFLIRGLSTSWKQIIAYHATASSTKGEDIKNFLFHVIEHLKAIGLNVVAVVSDMNSCNVSFWNAVNVKVNRTTRRTYFEWNDGSVINVFADPPHLLKNMWMSLQNNIVKLSPDILENEGLPSSEVKFAHVVNLWELQRKDDLKLLYHLEEGDIRPSHFQKMDVGRAVRFFSVKTAAALETAVALKLLPPDALSTAWFVRLFCQWFQIMSARTQLKSVTANNFDTKKKLMDSFVEVISTLEFDKGWKPVQTGTILSTISLLKVCEHCFKNDYKFVLGSRLTQDALENVFSTIRSKTKSMPTILDCVTAIKLVSVAQFLEKEPNLKSGYAQDNDHSLLNILDPKERQAEPQHTHFDDNVTKRLKSAIEMNDNTNVVHKNSLFYIAGSCVHSLMKSACNDCQAEMTGDVDDLTKAGQDSLLLEYTSYGGLIYPSMKVYNIVKAADAAYTEIQMELLQGKYHADDEFVNIVLKYCKTTLPSCCEVMKKIIQHFVTVRSYETAKNTITKSKNKTYSTNSASK
ncbi:uncharacterized protein LOC111615469 [Centruroides sculpturatus]|uniref:uncharacterized protein LOC111615469 n=1 Tax=Centruroides sculpturatus TaxID=218467 RepID=UPI000C6E6639|nr:uncharacterized protein LOC111615469 [Centruroides sculpturatus]